MIERQVQSMSRVTRLLHLGIASLCVWDWLIGVFGGAGDYDHAAHFWYLEHMWVGIAFVVFLLARLFWGVVGPTHDRFSYWVPWSTSRLKDVCKDVHTLSRLHLPARPPHAGLSGLVESLGILVFVWVGLTGVVNAIAITPGVRLEGWPRYVKVLHAYGKWIILGFLVLHVGATVWHSLAGDEVWRKMLFLEHKQRRTTRSQRVNEGS